MKQTTGKSVNRQYESPRNPAPADRNRISAWLPRACLFAALTVIITLIAGCIEELINTGPHLPPLPPPASQTGVLVDYLGNPHYPDNFWTAAIPESCGVNITPLEQAVEMIAASELEIYSILVAVNGKLVFERYGWSTGTNPDDPVKIPHQIIPYERLAIQSTTKSFTSTLIGIAISEGLISGVHDPIIPYFPKYQPLENSSPEKDAITIEDILTMRSGLQYSRDGNEHEILYAYDPAEAMLSRPVVDIPVGTVFNYSSASSDILAALLREVTGKKPLNYAKKKLFKPLGIHNVYWFASDNGTNHGGWGLELSSREMAKFGELYRNHGVWNGNQIVPADWIDSATAARCSTPNGDYGYQFWITKYPDAFGTRGAYGRHITVCRELGLVVVMTANFPIGARAIFDNIMANYIIPAVTDSTMQGGIVTFNVSDIDASYNGKQVLLSLQAGTGQCSPDNDNLYTGAGIIAGGECQISIGSVANGSYTVCAFIDVDGNFQPGPGDLFGQASVTVTGYTNSNLSALGWLEI